MPAVALKGGESSPPLSVKLPVERFYPSDSFGVINFTEISLSRCKVSMSQNGRADKDKGSELLSCRLEYFIKSSFTDKTVDLSLNVSSFLALEPRLPVFLSIPPADDKVFSWIIDAL